MSIYIAAVYLAVRLCGCYATSSWHSITNQQNKSAMMTDHFMGI